MTSHLTNQNAIDMAKEADPAGKRTLGIVTKPDRAVSADTNALDQLESGAFPMGLGFVVVSVRPSPGFCRHDKGLLGLELLLHLWSRLSAMSLVLHSIQCTFITIMKAAGQAYCVRLMLPVKVTTTSAT